MHSSEQVMGNIILAERSIKERVETTAGAQKKIHATYREELLGSTELKEVAYGFKLSSVLDEDQAIIALSALGEAKYRRRESQCNIYETECGNEYVAELRWPQDEAEWVESIKISCSVYSPTADLGIRFWRPAKELESIPQKSEQEAQKIYQQLEQLLRERQ